MEALLTKLGDYGLFALVVAVLFAGAWKGFAWLGEHVLTPMTKNFVEHIQSLGKVMDKVPPAMEAAATHIQASTVAMASMTKTGEENRLIMRALMEKASDGGMDHQKVHRALREMVDAALRAVEAETSKVALGPHYDPVVEHLKAARKEFVD